jgi:site-specific recombinase XerD
MAPGSSSSARRTHTIDAIILADRRRHMLPVGLLPTGKTSMTGERTFQDPITRPMRWLEMRDIHAALSATLQSFLIHRYDLSTPTQRNYSFAITGFADWCETTLRRPAETGDVEPGIVEAYLAFRATRGSPQSARSAWVALRSIAKFLAERRIHHDEGQSVLRAVRMPKVKDDARRALTDEEMWNLISRSAEGESGQRDSAIVWTLLGCGLRREELASLHLSDINFTERRLHVRVGTSKSVHARDVTMPVETMKPLDHYLRDFRVGATTDEAPLFTDRSGGAITGNAIRKLFERLKIKTGIRDLSAHMLRHTWATNFHRSGSGSRFDLMVEGGWTTGRMVERYTKARPFEERRKAPSPFTAARKRRAEKRPEGKWPSPKRSGLIEKQVA